MAKVKRQYPPSVPFETVIAKHMKEPEFRREYEALEPEFEIVRQIIDLRLRRKMTQTELARRIGAQQPSIARLERRGQTKNLDYLQRVAKALNAKLEVRLIPRRARGGNGSSRRAAKKL
jgi:DNA-binding XRE family transcriptional regulator